MLAGKCLANLCTKDNLAYHRVEAMSEHRLPVLAGGYDNGFLNAAVTAFAHHHPIALSPDHIWLLVLQAVAKHVDANAASLRSHFVHHEGEKSLQVRRDDFVRGSSRNDWPGVLREFKQQIAANLVDGVADRLETNFSTTGLAEEAAACVTTMDLCKNFFNYSMRTMCGIPKVTLEGIARDWDSLCEKAEQLVSCQCSSEFSEWWLPSLIPVLQKIAASARGDVDAAFWRSFVKRGSTHGSGAHSFISGWINCFFPLLDSSCKPNRWCQPYRAEEEWVLYAQGARDPSGQNWGAKKPFGQAYGPDEGVFPNGMARAPVVWLYAGSEIKMRFVAGLFGASQDPKTLTLRPEVGWAILACP